MRISKGAPSLVGTADRYNVSGKESDKGIKRASLFERITGRATQIIVDGQKYHVNKRSLNNYLVRKLTTADSAKAQNAVKGFFKAASVNDGFASFVKGKEEVLTRRGDILKELSSRDVKDLSKLSAKSGVDHWAVSLSGVSRTAHKAAASQNIFENVQVARASSKKVEGRPLAKRSVSHIKARPQSWHGETQFSALSIKGYRQINGRKMPVFDFSKMQHSIHTARAVSLGPKRDR